MLLFYTFSKEKVDFMNFACDSMDKVMDKSLEEVSTLRELAILLQFLSNFRKTVKGKEFLAEKSNNFIQRLVSLQKKINQIKPKQIDENNSELARKSEKQDDYVQTIKQLLKDVVQGGKAE